jgi:sulfur carrier protein ThiS adenylyltransferase
MNAFEKTLAEILGKENLAIIQKVKVGIAGAGGLGSNCALFLVRCGFKKFRIVDSDIVEIGNLNRQFYFTDQVGKRKVEALRDNLLLINPGLEIEALAKRIEQGNVADIFPDCDVVVEAFDGATDKRMIVEAYMSSGKLVVAASGLAGWDKSDDIKIHRIRDNFYLVGDLVSGIAPNRPPMAPKVNVAAAKQADVILSFFLGDTAGGTYDCK